MAEPTRDSSRAARGIRELGFAAAAGAATSLAFPPVGLWPVAIAGPALLLALLGSGSRRRGALVGFVFGVAFFGTLLSLSLIHI